MKRPRSTIKRVVVAVAIAIPLILVCAIPFVVNDDEYGDVQVPGVGTVHLPAGQTDVALCSQALDAGAEPVPPPALYVRITSLDGGPDPEVVDVRREVSGTRCDVLTQISEVRVLREGDYSVTVDGDDVCCPYEPRVIFGDFVWSTTALWLLACAQVVLGTVGVLVFGLGFTALAVGAMILAFVGVLRLFGKSGARKADPPAPVDAPDAADAEPSRPVELVDWPPADLVLHYPERSRLARFFSALWFLLSFGVVVVFPVWVTIWHLTAPGPVLRPAVVVLACWAVGFSCLFWRIGARFLLIRRRRAHGDGWLRLSANGFEVHGRSGKPRCHDWSDVEAFTLTETSDEGGTVTQHVCVHFTPERQLVDLTFTGYWDCSVQQGIDLMTGWQQSYRLAHARGLRAG